MPSAPTLSVTSEPGAPVAEAAAAPQSVAAASSPAVNPRLLLTAVGAQLFVFNTSPIEGLQAPPPHATSTSSQVHRQTLPTTAPPARPLQLIASVRFPSRIARASIAALNPEPRDAQVQTIPVPPAVVVIVLTTGVCLTLSLWDLSSIGTNIPLPPGTLHSRSAQAVHLLNACSQLRVIVGRTLCRVLVFSPHRSGFGATGNWF